LVASNEIDVLVVGAGAAGLTVAAEMLREGVSVRIIDKADEYFPGSRGKSPSCRTLEVLDDLGIIDQILELADTHEDEVYCKFFLGDQVVGALRGWGPATPDRPYLFTAFAPQWHTENVLREVLASYDVKVELSTELVDFAQDADGVTASVKAPNGEIETAHCSYLLGCDGSGSTVRKKLGIKFTGINYPGVDWLIGDVEVDGLEPDQMYAWASLDDGLVFLRPFMKGGVKIWQYEGQIAPDEDGNLPEPTVELMDRIVRERSGRTDLHLHDAPWVGYWRTNMRCAERYQDGRVFILGEAAHVQAGGGLSAGVQDAANMGWKMASFVKGSLPASLLATYDEERRPVDQEAVDYSIVRLEKAGLGFRRQDAKNTTGNKLDPTKMPESFSTKAEEKVAAELDVHYRGSRLGMDVGPVGDVRAGDRAPDSPCCDYAGSAVRLYDLFRGPHWTLLGFGPGGTALVRSAPLPNDIEIRAYTIEHVPAMGGEERTIVDADGYAHQYYGVDGDAVVLVRPDAYIGLFARPGRQGDLDRYLEGLRTLSR
jgi:2-polyprenyl-6-methoxyphenol hydroxylase-like FAD-dependent oxidoreductase